MPSIQILGRSDGVVGFLAPVGTLERVVIGMINPVSITGEDLEASEVRDAKERIRQQGARMLEELGGSIAAEP